MVCFFHQPAQQWFLGENGKQRRAQLCSGRWCWPRWYFNNERSRLDVTNKRKEKKKQKHNKATKTTNNPWKGPSVFNLGGRHGSKRISFAQILPRVPVPHKPAFQGKYSPRLMDNIRCFPQRPKQWQQTSETYYSTCVSLSPLLPSTAGSESPCLFCALIAIHLLWILPLQIKQPRGGLGNYFSSQAATIAASICRPTINQCLLENVCFCVKIREEFGQLGNCPEMCLKVRNRLVMSVHTTANGSRGCQVPCCGAADPWFVLLMAGGNLGQCRRSPGALLMEQQVGCMSNSRAVHINVPFRW